MVAYIRSDLDFILAQIKIAEAHSLHLQTNGAEGKPLFGEGGSIPTYNLSWGLRTVDGTYNNPLHPEWGAADNPFPEGLGTDFRTIMVPAGPGGMLVPVSYNPTVDNDGPGSAGPGDVFDPYVRTISNLIVDQTLGNPSAILTALQRAGIVAPANQMAMTAQISAAYEPLRPLFTALEDAQRANAAAQAAASASPGNEALQAAAAITAAAVAAAEADLVNDVNYPALTTLLETNGIELDGSNVVITNAAPDEGLSAPFNSWFTLFGQFFDHGLDLVGKGGTGTVFIPLMPDDPLYVPGGTTNFMVLTRATTMAPGADGVLGDDPGTAINESLDDVPHRPINTTTSFVDQNQTYTSHPSHQVFLRAYTLNAAGDPVATGKLIEGGNGGMATWADLKAQARDLLGIHLVDANVGNVPLLATDPYGEFIRGDNGYPQIVTTTGLVEGDPTANGGLGISLPANTIFTGHAFLADIAHNAVPAGLEDGDTEIGLGNGDGTQTDGTYDNELLDAHYIAGDGRANENIGLTAVHHVFHSEHNRLVEHTKSVVFADAQALLSGGASPAEAVAFLNEWLADDVATVPATADNLVWDGERIFQAAKFGTEMQYQHLVFEEFARKIQPNINVFLVPDGFDVTIDPSIVAEFAHVVYRFGHSMLTETIDRFDPTFTPDQIGLIEGFLNPIQFENNGGESVVDADISAGAIIRGMTRQAGNEIDEFVTSALRNNLLGLPLDLATINLARGRDTGVPSLNAAREQFYEATGENSLLKPYESWVDFAGHLKNEASIINFIAAYGTHPLIAGQQTIEGKRDAALTIITGVSVGGLTVPPDAVDFLNATGTYAGGPLGGLNLVDLWIGGLAEEIMPFGGMLGSTFNFVFETQMESLQNGDRFYYLQRLDGLHLFGEMEGNSFASMIMRNTDATHLPSDVFSTPGLILEVDQTKQFNDTDGDGVLDSLDPAGGGILTPLVVRQDTDGDGDVDVLRYTGDEHVLLGGTEEADSLTAGIGDDTLFGDGGNDKLEGGFGNDIINGGAGDDIIRDMGGDDNIKAEDGNDVVHAGPGLDLVMGGRGQDFIVLGTDMGSEVFAGEGNDFIFGNKNAERILGNEGNDWIETGTFDGAPGDNFDEIFAHDAIDGHDVFLGDGGFDEFIGEGGDDIFVGSPGRGKMAGMSGFDWATYKNNTAGVNADLSIPIIFDEAPVLPENAALDEFESVQGLSGSRFNDVLKGSDEDATTLLPLAQGGSTGFLGSVLDAQGIAMVEGLQAVVGAGVTSFAAGDIILGGDGSDLIQGNAGDDIIDGDKWLNVRISIRATAGANGPTGAEIGTATGMTAKVYSAAGVELYGGRTLSALMFDGTLNPGQLQIAREILTDTTAGDIDTAQYQGNRSEYAFSATADGQVIVTHAIEDALDGSDRLRNIEKVQFADGGALNIIVGTPGNDTLNGTAQDDLLLGLDGADTLNGGAGNDILVGGANVNVSGEYADDFNTSSFGNSDGATNWAPDWAESGDGTGAGSPTAGQIRLDDGSNALRFTGGAGAGFDGAQITRVMDLSAASTATITYSANPDNLDAGESVTVLFAANGIDFVPLQTITGNGGTTDYTHNVTGPFTSTAAIRFVTTALNATNEVVAIDNLAVSFSAVETLNGGLGDDTYSFSLGDGIDVINEAVNATSGGSADRISILAPSTGIDPETGLPILTINSLNASDSSTGGQAGDLVINYILPTGTQQTITVAGHFNGANAQTGVERINFNGASYAGYALGAADYLISRTDGNVNLAASTANNFVAGESSGDTLTGGLGNDLIFGGGGDNTLNGGAGDDLLVGGSGAGDDDLLDGGLDADTMVGLGGNDTYIVDDLLDVVVEAAGQGTDEVETEMAALSIELMANVENLTYTGIDADPFVGTGNGGNNVITGGDLNDTLSGLAGNDTLNGGLGADTMIGGAGNDTYVVDDAADVVDESTGLPADVDTVQTGLTYTLATGLENLTLTGGDAVDGTGNAANNVLIGNGASNRLFGGTGTDTLTGNDGDDLLDGGVGNDTLNGGDDNDTIIGGAGNDTIDVGGGLNTLIYNSTGFGDDIVTSFDSVGGTATTQDFINLSALGVTAANFGTRVTIADIEDGAVDDTLITVRDAANAVIGTIRLEEVEATGANGVTSADFILAAAPPAPFGAPTNAANTITGNAAANTIDGLGGNDTLSGAAGNDVIIGGEGADTLNGDDGNDTLSGGVGSNVGTFADNFNTAAYSNNTGTASFAGNWTEADNNSATTGDIEIDGGRLRFNETVDGGETIERALNLAGATTATLSFTFEDDNLGAGQSVTVQARNVVTNAWETLTAGTNGGVLGSTTGNGNGNFTATLTANQIGATSAIRFLTTGDGNNWDGGDNFYIENLSVSATIPGLNSGVDTVNGGAGDDTIVWNANSSGSTDGRDVVDGGTEASAGDTFVINGNTEAETYRIYTRAEAVAAGITGLLANTEIVVTRNGTTNASVIAELREIEEIRINGTDPAGPSGGAGAGDNFIAIGDFSGTSLRLNTITIDGQASDDKVDISALTSAHRIVFRSNGGADTIVGTLRAQDVIEVPAGSDPADYELTVNPDGTKTLSTAGHSVTFTGEVPTLDVAGGTAAAELIGTTKADELKGTASGEMISALAGNDKVWAGGGDDRVIAEKGDGNDTYWGEDGSDTLDMSAITAKITADLGSGSSAKGSVSSSHTGSDTLWGVENIVTGSGNDLIVASKAVNVMDAGEGSNTFRFLSAAHADGDTIVGFQPGDKIDLSHIDTNGSAKGDGKFTLVSDAFSGGSGELLITHETRGGEDYTVIQGTTSADDFKLSLKGTHDLTAGDFNL